MNIATINGLLASSGGNGQLASLSELAGNAGTIDFQSLLTAASKGNRLPTGNLPAELQALFAGDLPTSEIDSAIAALLAENRSRSAETSTSSDPVLPATEDSRSDTTDALLAAIAQAMSGQAASTTPTLPAAQGNTALTSEEGSKLVASPRTSAPTSSLDLSNNLQQPTEPDTSTSTGPLSNGSGSGNSTLFQVDRSNSPALANILLPNAAAIGNTPQPNGIPPRSTVRSNIQNAIASALPSDMTKAATQSEQAPLSPLPQSLTTPMSSNSAGESHSWRQFENAVTNTESRIIRTPVQSFAASIAIPAAVQAANPGQLVNDSLSPSTELSLEAANTAGTLTSSLPMASTSAQHPRGTETQASPAAISAPLHDRAAWTQDFGDRIVWMAKQDQQSADIRITPANLGPVQISLNIDDGKASAMFVSPHAEVRQALEEALPRLREMLNAAGISLGQANVGSQMPQQQSDSAPRFTATPRNTGENAILSGIEGNVSSTSTSPIRQGRGLVDLFA